MSGSVFKRRAKSPIGSRRNICGSSNRAAWSNELGAKDNQEMAETSIGKLTGRETRSMKSASGRKAGSLSSPEDSLNRAIILACCKRMAVCRFRRSPPRLNVSEGISRNRFNRMKEVGHSGVVAPWPTRSPSIIGRTQCWGIKVAPNCHAGSSGPSRLSQPLRRPFMSFG